MFFHILSPYLGSPSLQGNFYSHPPGSSSSTNISAKSFLIITRVCGSAQRVSQLSAIFLFFLFIQFFFNSDRKEKNQGRKHRWKESPKWERLLSNISCYSQTRLTSTYNFTSLFSFYCSIYVAPQLVSSPCEFPLLWVDLCSRRDILVPSAVSMALFGNRVSPHRCR